MAFFRNSFASICQRPPAMRHAPPSLRPQAGGGCHPGTSPCLADMPQHDRETRALCAPRMRDAKSINDTGTVVRRSSKIMSSTSSHRLKPVPCDLYCAPSVILRVFGCLCCHQYYNNAKSTQPLFLVYFQRYVLHICRGGILLMHCLGSILTIRSLSFCFRIFPNSRMSKSKRIRVSAASLLI